MPGAWRARHLVVVLAVAVALPACGSVPDPDPRAAFLDQTASPTPEPTLPVPPPAESAEEVGGAAGAPRAVLAAVRIAWRSPLRPPVVRPPGSTLPSPRWPRGPSGGKLDLPDAVTVTRQSAVTVRAHLSPSVVSAEARRIDDVASAWAVDLGAKAEHGAADVASRLLRDRLELQAELRQLSLDYLGGLWCSWMQGAVLQPKGEGWRLDTESDAALRDAVLERAGAALGGHLGRRITWLLYVASMRELVDDLVQSTWFEDNNGVTWRVDPRMPMAVPPTSPFHYVVPAARAVIASAGELRSGVLFWYRTCYRPPSRR